MKFVTARERSRSLHIEITPMIDVVFLLIIFFMTTAQFARMTRAELSLPVEPGDQEQAPYVRVDPTQDQPPPVEEDELSELQELRDVGGVEVVEGGEVQHHVGILVLPQQLQQGGQVVRKAGVVLKIDHQNGVGPALDGHGPNSYCLLNSPR